MKYFLFILLSVPAFAYAAGIAGNYEEEIILALSLCSVFLIFGLLIQWMDKKIKGNPRYVLGAPDFVDPIPDFEATGFQLRADHFSENPEEFDLIWCLFDSKNEVQGEIRFMGNYGEGAFVQMAFNIVPEYSSREELLPLIENCLTYIWTHWEQKEIEKIKAFISEDDLIGEALLEALGFEEMEVEGEIIEFEIKRPAN
ncbi:MAG: hypothetical protein R8P61_09305 [Bacteroidia bacterium]|nr:hypothetical protein [Bacteroidia bacterium]